MQLAEVVQRYWDQEQSRQQKGSMSPQVTRQLPGKPAARPQQTAVNAWELVDTLRVLLYGASGTGKTTCWASFPEKILAVICSGGNKPGELRSINTPENRARITPRIITDTGQLKSLLEQEAPGYATVVLDHASGLEDLVLKEILGLKELPAQKSWGIASQQQYGQCAQQCKEYIRTLLNLPGNVVIVAQERVFRGKDDGTADDVIKPTVGPGVMPSLASWLMPACDYVVQTFKRPKITQSTSTLQGRTVTVEKREKGVDYAIRTGPHDVFCTKFRVPKGMELPDHVVLGIEDSAYEKLMGLINGTP